MIIDLTQIPTYDIPSEKNRVREDIQAQIKELIAYNRDAFAKLFNSVWKDPALTPQQVFDAFGPEASQLFQLAGSYQAYFNSIVPGICPQVPPAAFEVNADGTVTIK